MELTVAMPVLALVNEPVGLILLIVIVDPVHTTPPPLTVFPGLTEFTVTVAVDVPQLVVYVIVAVPDATPVTTPVVEPTEAIPVLPLLQVPPVVASLRVVVAPAHTVNVPVIAAGDSHMVTVEARFQRSAAVAYPS